MIYVQPFSNNFFDNFLSHIHIIFLFFFSITLIFVSIHTFLYKNIVVYLVVTQNDVQITLLIEYNHIPNAFEPGGCELV